MKKISSNRSGVDRKVKSLSNSKCFSFLSLCFISRCGFISLLRTLSIAGVFCLLSITSALSAESAIRFREINGCLIIVPLTIDGKGPFDFIIDTGSDDTAIDIDLVQELGVKPTGTVTLITAAGSQEVPAGYPLKNVKLGSHIVPAVKALAMNFAALRPHKVRGIVGQNLLAQFNYFLDFKRHEMTIEQGNDLSSRLIGNAKTLNSQKVDGRWMVFVPREEGPTLKMVLDAGANELVIYDCEKLSLDVDQGSFHSVNVATNLATRGFRAARLRRFEIGGIVLRNLTVVLAKNGTGNEAHPEDGLLPARLFNGIYFNNAERQVVFNPEFGAMVPIAGNR
jgi:predicted aspartyl protease